MNQSRICVYSNVRFVPEMPLVSFFAPMRLLDVTPAEQKAFDEAYLEQFGAVGMEATTVVEPKKFVIETENATIQVDPSRSDLVEMKRIDGRRYVLVAVEGEATVNGVEVNIL